MPAFTRRQFATSIAASAILAPFLRFGERPARAATGKAKRLLIFYTMGTHPDMWRPTSVMAENNFTFSAMTVILPRFGGHHSEGVDGVHGGAKEAAYSPQVHG